MILAIFLSTIVATATPQSENDILQVFGKTKGLQTQFLKDTAKYRAEIESFDENEYVPAVEKMIILIKEKKCLKCLEPYLESLVYMSGSANEDLSDQLNRLILDYPVLINDACERLSKNTKKKLESWFTDSLQMIEIDKKIKYSTTKKTISKCFLPNK